MGFITYKQADSRWGKKNYNGSSTMATAGCGPTSCAMIAYGIDGKTTPINTMKYMQKHGFAIRNNGTAWAGIPSCLKAFGLKDVQNVPDMAKCWELMKKGYVGVFLFRSGSRGGVTWTTSGHYVAVTDYKVQNGKHYVYTRDSGGRNHTGWYAYETTMRGLIPQIWLGKIEKKESTPSESVTTPSVVENEPSVSENAPTKTNAQLIGDMALELSWATNTPKSQWNYSYSKTKKWTKWSQLGKAKPKKKCMEAMDKYMKDHWSKGSAKYGYGGRVCASCDKFVGLVIRATGVNKSMPSTLDEFFKGKGFGKFEKVKTGGKKAKMKHGDVIVYKRKSGGGHTLIVAEHNGTKLGCQAGLNHYFPRRKKLTNYDLSDFKKFDVWRAK